MKDAFLMVDQEAVSSEVQLPGQRLGAKMVLEFQKIFTELAME